MHDVEQVGRLSPVLRIEVHIGEIAVAGGSGVAREGHKRLGAQAAMTGAGAEIGHETYGCVSPRPPGVGETGLYFVRAFKSLNRARVRGLEGRDL